MEVKERCHSEHSEESKAERTNLAHKNNTRVTVSLSTAKNLSPMVLV